MFRRWFFCGLFVALFYMPVFVAYGRILSPGEKVNYETLGVGVCDGTVKLMAVYVKDDNQIDCGAGYYLPKGKSDCEICSSDHYCGGGKYAVNASESQGIVECDAGLKSPNGSMVASDCGIVLRIGDDKLWLHQYDDRTQKPAFVVNVDGKKYYADMTRLSDGRKVISSGAGISWHVRVDNQEYVVHDRTVK